MSLVTDWAGRKKKRNFFSGALATSRPLHYITPMTRAQQIELEFFAAVLQCEIDHTMRQAQLARFNDRDMTKRQRDAKASAKAWGHI